VRALGQVRILTLDKKSLVRRIHEDPSLAYYMMQTMSQRVRELNAEVARLERVHPETQAITTNRANDATCPFDCCNYMDAAVFRAPVVLS
jgi:CRP-like cAMP-binding protein